MKRVHWLGIIFVVMVLLLGLGIYLLIARERKTAAVVSSIEKNNYVAPSAVSVNLNQNKDVAQTFKNNWLTFRYPATLALKDQGGIVGLTHSVAYPHPNFCELRGGAKQLDAIIDFNLSFTLIDKSLKNAVRDIIPSNIINDYFKSDSVNLTPGYIDELNTGVLKGYRITNGAEGCGEYAYFFPLSPDSTLRVTRAFVSEFQPINANAQTYLKVPGIIPPDEEKNIFQNILLSLRIQKK
jgi:hypothetical protein